MTVSQPEGDEQVSDTCEKCAFNRCLVSLASDLAQEFRREIADLRARLKTVRAIGPALVGDHEERVLFRNATNLRVKNWRDR